MKILQVSIFDLNGGAEKVAYDLHQKYLEWGHEAKMVVGTKRGADSTIHGLSAKKYSASWWLYRCALEMERKTGIQAMGYGEFRKWWRKFGKGWDIVHLHNLHSHYFDLSALSDICRDTHIVQTLHDCWQLTGHCAHPGSCERWRSGCGNCPDLGAYPPVSVDRTKYNWQRKKRIYDKVRPVLVAPSHWLKEKVAASLLSGFRCEVIPNGVDEIRYAVGDQLEARHHLQLPKEAIIVLYVANGGLASTHHKDPELALASIRALALENPARPVVLVVVGGIVELSKEFDGIVIQRGNSQNKMPLYYQAADIYIHPTKADTAPLVLLEAGLTGLPVVASDVGGCRELLRDHPLSIVVEPNDEPEFINALKQLVRSLGSVPREKTAECMRKHSTLSNMATRYLALYADVLSDGRHARQ